MQHIIFWVMMTVVLGLSFYWLGKQQIEIALRGLDEEAEEIEE